ncbi:MAG: hypothetical protein JST28_08425 [Acidobacteria bacterium]|nr:hypothetical protein [Acidobacteriota bacterium]
MKVSQQLIENCQKSPERRAWLDGLPDLLSQLQIRWSIRTNDPFDQNATCSWVAPVTRFDGETAVLKIAMPHMEGRDEIAGLRYWDGNCMVRLLEADPESGAMLIERCLPGSNLHSEPETRQDEVIAQLLKGIWSQTCPSSDLSCFRPLSRMVNSWREETMAQRHLWADADLVKEGLAVVAKLAEPAGTDVLLVTDLHAGNVLRSDREPWLAIDPKPFVGDRTYDLVQHLFNCEARLHNEPQALIKRIASLAEVDAHRLRLWAFGRAASDPREDWANARWIRTARALAL